MSKIVLKILLTIILFFIIGLMYLIYYPKLDDKYNKILNKTVDEVHYNIINNKIDEIQNVNIPENTIIALWMKSLQSQWIPIIIDKKIIVTPDNLRATKDIPKIPGTISIIAKQLKIDIKRDGYSYIIWVNRFNYNIIVKNIILLLLYIIAGYIILLMIFEILINPDKISFKYSPEEKNIININKSNQIDPLNDYKNLWIKNFKISDKFKNNFPFTKVNDLISVTIKSADYLKECLNISNTYFQWRDPKIFISHKNRFINVINNEILNESDIQIPENSSCKGDIFIPLYPYNKNNIFGHLNFKWEKDYDFNIADILYFLKFIFSEKTKNIFVFENEAEKIVNNVNQKMGKYNEVFFGLIQVDNKEKIAANLNVNQKEKLNNNIKDLILKKFNNINFVQVSSLSYIFFGEEVQKEVFIPQIKDFISNIENQNFNIDNVYGNIAVTYSCGVSFKNKRNIHAVSLIKEAEADFNNAERNGGNMVVFN